MNKNIMDQEISKTEERNCHSNPKKKIEILAHTQEKTNDSRHSENEEEKIIMFKETPGFFFMMVLVQ